MSVKIHCSNSVWTIEQGGEHIFSGTYQEMEDFLDHNEAIQGPFKRLFFSKIIKHISHMIRTYGRF